MGLRTAWTVNEDVRKAIEWLDEGNTSACESSFTRGGTPIRRSQTLILRPLVPFGFFEEVLSGSSSGEDSYSGSDGAERVGDEEVHSEFSDSSSEGEEEDEREVAWHIV